MKIFRGKDVRPLRAVECGLSMHRQFCDMALPWLPHGTAETMPRQGHGSTTTAPGIVMEVHENTGAVSYQCHGSVTLSL